MPPMLQNKNICYFLIVQVYMDDDNFIEENWPQVLDTWWGNGKWTRVLMQQDCKRANPPIKLQEDSRITIQYHHYIEHQNINGARSYFSKFSSLVILFILRTITPKMQIQNFSWKGQSVWMYQAILYIAAAYILLCKLNYGYHNQARFH